MKKILLWIILLLILISTWKAVDMYRKGQWCLWPCVHLFGKWYQVPLWPCPPGENPAGDKWEWKDGKCC